MQKTNKKSSKSIAEEKLNHIRHIQIKNANQNNLKNISVNIPRNQLTIITGVSGSGKSTLAFDTLYAEGQRRFVESLSSYARQFLARMSKPDVESIIGLPPAVAIEQKAPPKNPRSTVGTTTEIYDYIRALYARIGKTFCSKCGKQIYKDTPELIVKRILQWKKDDKIYLLFNLKPTLVNIGAELDKLNKAGFTRVLINKPEKFGYKNFDANEIVDSSNLKITVQTKPEDISILVDRIVVSDDKDTITRLNDSVEIALNAGFGKMFAKNITQNIISNFSSVYECADCNIQYEIPEPRLFAFNSPRGACPHCQGLGQAFGIDENLVIPDKSLSLEENCIAPYRMPSTAMVFKEMIAVCQNNNIPTNIPYSELTDSHKELIWEGKEKYFGLNGYFNYLETKSHKLQNRLIVSRYRGMATCLKCNGSRIRESGRQVFIYGKNIPEIVNMPISELYEFIKNLPLNDYEHQATEQIMLELNSRIKMLLDIGLDYLTLARNCQTLSGGEYQRINLSTALGSSLVGTLYVLDEPSIGMHPRDTERLLQILFRLRNLGNTIVVVEHDPEIIKNADFVIDVGIGAGIEGGNIISQGTFDDLLANKESLTAQYFNNEKNIVVPNQRRAITSEKITVLDAAENNLKIPKISIPLNTITVITGVSGSGKSSFVYNVLYAGIRQYQGKAPDDLLVGKFTDLQGYDLIGGVELVDQSPIGRSSRSTPATYLKIYDTIRELFSQTQAAVQLGLKPGYFSFNVPGGRCEVCEGEGYVNIDMQFLPDLKILCEACNGERFKKEVKNIIYKGKNIVEVLDMTVDEAAKHFKGVHKIEDKFKTLQDVGLGYLKLGQSSSALSGGEAQRIKLASHIEASVHTNILYIFDEPTTGLHLDDISNLISSLNNLVDRGNTVLIIEHNLNIMSIADWIIDLGPEAGNRGGEIVAEGTPEQIATVDSHTGKALKNFLKK